jgi:seryl-tRNA synthetase
MLRVHQFDKVEMFSYTLPEQSDEEFKFLLSISKEIVDDLKLPYQVVAIASGDLGDPAAAKFDIETWLPGQKKYRETHSISTTTDFQSRRLNIRYKKSQGETGLVYTLNGTAVAVGRTLIAIMENYQQADGSIKIPEVLVPYMGKEVINVNHN